MWWQSNAIYNFRQREYAINTEMELEKHCKNLVSRKEELSARSKKPDEYLIDFISR